MMKSFRDNFFSRIILSLLTMLPFACGDEEEKKPLPEGMDFREEMRNFVTEISGYAKNRQPSFIIIPQNGQELASESGDGEGPPAIAYLDTIEGVGREDLFFGYDNDDKPTPTADKNYMLDYLKLCEDNQVEVLVTDYCYTHSKMDDSYAQNEAKGFISFAAPERDLNVIPDYPAHPFHENNSAIFELTEAKNFLYLLDPENFATKQEMMEDMAATNYDVLIIDMFFDEAELTSADVDALSVKANGAHRLVICYMSIGEVEDYRFYWQDSWRTDRPAWMEAENPDWEGNYKVRYWDPGWKSIIMGSPNAYLDKIIAAGFDGVYLDIIDAFEYFENY